MISKRIKELANLIDNKYSVIDIGCDHGYLAQLLREKGNKNIIICSDEKKGPLDNARKNLAEYADIIYCLSDGVKSVDKQANIAVMAGMGHNTVEHIIMDCEDYFRNCQKIIIEVNTQVDDMRRWLTEHNFKIVDERIIHDYKYYEILVVENGYQKLNEKQIMFGPVLLDNKNYVFMEYWTSTAKKLKTIADKLDDNHPDNKKILYKVQIIENMLKEKQQ